MRSDSTSALTENDIRILRQIGIKKAIDLRISSEIQGKPSKLSVVEGINYFNIPIPLDFHNSSFSVSSLSDVYICILSLCKQEISDVFSELSEMNPCIFFCTGGKDRTGLISILLLSLVGVSDEDIKRDYIMSKDLLDEEFQKLKAQVKKNKLSIPLYGFECDVSFVDAVLHFTRERYYSVRQYLVDCGVSENKLDSIINGLLSRE